MPKDGDQNERVSELFFQCCDLDEVEAGLVLDRACGDDTELREKVEALLRYDRARSDGDLTDIVDAGLRSAAADLDEPPEEAPEAIDGYTVVREIGEGGMSVVYEAEQHRPVRRRVALKVIRPGMDTREVVARFESERQALAVMDHPNIARIFDGGAGANGRPYFVMELVDGVPVTDYCNERSLSVEARLRLFLDVCAAVQHAHQKGVVHRDLKPSNILVAEHESRPSVKVIDFGIAKAVADTQLGEDEHVTRLGQMIGTPAYMSPEQAEGRTMEVDTRTDVYSLGVLMYQVLVGVLPFEFGPSVMRSLRETDRDSVPRPSARFATLGNRRARLATERRTDPAGLGRKLASNLDWIVLRAMENAPERRYQTVNALAEDIERYLDDRPVTARPPSRAYVLGRFVKRNRKTVFAAAAVLLALVGGIAVATVGLVRAIEAERVASREAATSAQVSEFLVGLFEISDPGESRGQTVTAKEILDVGVGNIETALVDQPEVQTRMMNTMGRVYRNIGLYEEAMPLFRHALERRRDTLGPDHADVAETLEEFGVLLRLTGDTEGAAQAHREALRIRRDVFGEPSAEAAQSLNNLGLALYEQGEYAAAEPLFRQGLAMYRQLDPPDEEGLSINLNNLAGLLDKQGDFAGAERLYRESLALRRSLHGERHPQIATVLNNLGVLMAEQGDYERAEPFYRDALAMRRAVLGNDHMQVGISLNNLALLLRRKGDFAAAEPLYRESLEVRRRALGDEHPAVATGLNNLAGLLLARGDLAGAESVYRESLLLREQIQGADHPNVAVTRVNLAAALVDQQRYAEALAETDTALLVLNARFPADHWRVAVASNVRGAALAGLQRYGEAEALLLESLPVIREARGDSASYTRRAMERAIDLYTAWGKTEAAATYRTQLAAIDAAD